MTKTLDFLPGDHVSFKSFRDGSTIFGHIYGSFKKSPDIYRIVYWDGNKAAFNVCNKYAEDLTFVERHSAVKKLVEKAEKPTVMDIWEAKKKAQRENTVYGTINVSDIVGEHVEFNVSGFGKGDKVRSKNSQKVGHVVGFRKSTVFSTDEIQVEFLSGTRIWFIPSGIEHVPTPAPKAGSGFKEGDVVYVGATEDSELAPFVFKDGNFTPAAPKPKFAIGDRVRLNQDFTFYNGTKGDLGTVTKVGRRNSYGHAFYIKWDNGNENLPKVYEVYLDLYIKPKVTITVNTLAYRAQTIATILNAQTQSARGTADPHKAEVALLANLVVELAKKLEEKS